ncbi:protein ALP1-like [Hordeum vulgare subsp. vulgare]|uniref:protein ALP1-like n=1 Tax=Hordeum vulgare subsp. vulgare TaxID=112509 RepID=UPI001D1A3D86|nr:protein ALP1-like [Hordeum vulgare subsp. vulgare]
MDMYPEDEDEEIDFYILAMAHYLQNKERLPYAPRRAPAMTGLQWVEEKEMDPKAFYSMFKIRRSVFYPLHDTLVEKYGLRSTCNMSSKEQPKYHNRKGVTTQNVMAICDFDMRFIFVVVGWPGSVHDTRVWADARVEYPSFPHPPNGKYYLVDSGYPNIDGYLAPYKGQRYHVHDFQQVPPRGRNETFNHLHSSLQNVIERSFGVLKMKWRILLGIRRYKVETQTMIITACTCLHNYIRESKLPDEHFTMVENGSYVHEESASHQFAPYDEGNMGSVRDAIAASVFP